MQGVRIMRFRQMSVALNSNYNSSAHKTPTVRSMTPAEPESLKSSLKRHAVLPADEMRENDRASQKREERLTSVFLSDDNSGEGGDFLFLCRRRTGVLKLTQ